MDAAIPQLSIEARRIPNVRRSRIPDRETWLGWRQNVVGCSEAPALFGAHPYLTPLQLYALKTGAYRPDFASATIDGDTITLPPGERGLWLEAPTFELARRLRPHWHIQPNPVPGGFHFVHEAHQIASTPDAFIYSADEDGPGVLQVKSVADPVFRKTWFNDGQFEPPLWIIIQTMVDAALSGCSWGYIGVLVVGFEASFRLYRVTLKPALIARSFELVDEFWQRVERSTPYEPDFARDGAVIAAIYGDDSEPAVDLVGEKAARMAELLGAREILKALEKSGAEAEKQRKPIDAEIIFTLGNAAGGTLPDGRVVTAKTIQRAGFQVRPTSYRTVKVVDRPTGKSRAMITSMPDTF